MKKQWLSLVFAVVLMLAPVAGAGDGSAFGSFEDWFGQMVAFFLGDGPELGSYYPPNALTGAPSEVGLMYPPNGATGTGNEPEVGLLYPPGGDAAAGEEPEIGLLYPPSG